MASATANIYLEYGTMGIVCCFGLAGNDRNNEPKLSRLQWQQTVTAQAIRQPKQLEDTRLALEKEREMSELKSQFIAIACHEFRSPLTTILLSCDFLRNHSDKISEEKKQRFFQSNEIQHQTLKSGIRGCSAY